MTPEREVPIERLQVASKKKAKKQGNLWHELFGKHSKQEKKAEGNLYR